MKNYIIAWISAIVYFILTLLLWNFKVNFFLSGIHFGLLIMWGLEILKTKQIRRK